MARGPRYKVKFRRRREGKTNYYKRFKLIKSGRLRLVVRKSNYRIVAHIVEATPIGDVTHVYASTQELRGFGWKGSLKCTPAAYLLGLVVGYKALLKGIKEVILDIGLHRPARGCRVFAVLKGVLDSGVKVPHVENVFPSNDRIRGAHIAKYADMLKSTNPELYKLRFSQYLRNGLEPERIVEHFEMVKSKIVGYFTKMLKKAAEMRESKQSSQ